MAKRGGASQLGRTPELPNINQANEGTGGQLGGGQDGGRGEAERNSLPSKRKEVLKRTSSGAGCCVLEEEDVTKRVSG